MDKVAIKVRLQEMGNRAATSYLGEGSQLNESVTKLARDNKLSTEEIARVCEMANTEVFQRKYASEDNKMFEFPLADPSQVIQDMNAREKVAETSDDLAPYMTDVQIERSTPSEPMKKVATEVGEMLFQETKDGDGYLPSRSQFTWDLFTKMAICKDELHQELAESVEELEKTADEFVHLASQYVLDGDDINELYDWVREARPKQQHTVCHLFNKVASQLHVEHKWNGCRIEKTAAPVAEDLIRPTLSIGGMPVKIINGENPMIQTLDTLVEQAKTVDRNMIGYFGVTDKIKFLKGKVTENLSQEHQLVGDEVE